MNYDESVRYIHSLLKFGIRPGLSRMDAVLSCVGNPHKGKRFIHIAGTNGKGSTATATAGVLTAAGYKTGLFISPYVTHFLERVQIDGAPVSEDIFAGAVTDFHPYAEQMAKDGDSLTEFELLTAAAFLCYERESCDVAVLETGLGGRLDSTNIIEPPLVSVITSISLDHTAILGDTLEQIAYEKCGIIKSFSPVVCASGQTDAAFRVVENTAEERGCKLVVPDASRACVKSADIFGTDFSYENKDYRVGMAGEHQVSNMLTVIETVKILREQGFLIPQDALYHGIADTRLPARIEILEKSPLVILDGGHNPDGVAALVKTLEKAIDGKKLTVILGMMADKDIETCVRLFGTVAGKILCVTPNNPRALSGEALAEIAARYCADVSYAKTLNDVYPAVLNTLEKDDILLIAGSLYLAGEVKRESVL